MSETGRRPPTMWDIARASGVSQSTVSRILTGGRIPVPIKPATRDRVLQVARELHYRPNPLARGLRGAPTMLLGVIVREITDPFFAAAIDAITAEANARGYNVMLGHAHGRADEAIALRAVLETRHCDAILFVGDLSDEPRLLADLRESDVRIVGAWQGSALPGVTTVNVDDRAGIRMVVDHLAGLGHRRIAFIGGRFDTGIALGDIRQRRAAFLERLDELGLPPRDELLREATNTFRSGSAALADLMAQPEPPTAVVASTDVLAVGALHGAHSLGLAVPRDLSITGFDDLPIAEFAVPPLTSVHQPIPEMTVVAVREALEQPADPTAQEFVLPPRLVVRESTGPAPG